MSRRHLALFAFAVAVAVAAACPVGAQSPAEPGDTSSPAAAIDSKTTFEFARIRSKVLPGDVVGHFRSGFFCGTVVDSRAPDRIEQVETANAALAFKFESRELGVNLFEHDVSPFESAAPKSTDYRIGGTLQRIYFDTCADGPKKKGNVELEVKWDVYSMKQQRVVMTKTTSGDFKSDEFVAGAFETRAYVKSLRAMMLSDDFKALAAGRQPVGDAASTWPPLHIKPGSAAVDGDAQARAETLTKAVVTIVSDIGTGTGFYIAEGYLLTDRHVVGSSRYVKVKLSSGRQLVGEVLRQDAARDVALVQTESSGTPTLRLNLVDPPVGASMFAIGSPLGEALAGTFTRGVLSGIRDANGTRFLQSDVAINHGNSGGPLIDATSHVVGLADLVINQTQGLSFFVPIKDALDRLAIVVDDAPATP